MDHNKGYPHPNAPQGYPQPQDPYQGAPPPQGPYPGYPPAQAPYPVYPPLDQFHDKPSEPGFQPPPPSYTVHPNVPMEVQPTVVVPMATITQVGPDPQHLVCPSCHATITTRVEHEATARTHIMAAILCLFLCWPCVCVPYCMNSCQNTNHYCPNCKCYLGSYKS